MKCLISCLMAACVSSLVALAQSTNESITDFGAKADGSTVNTATIQKALDACRDAGGGTVVVPPGIFMTGTLRLYSNVELHLAEGAVLKGTTRLDDYLLDGKRVGLLFTRGAVNVAITGPGAIDGNGDAFMDLAHPKSLEHAGTSWTRQKEHFREIHGGLGDGPVVPKDRPYQMIIFSDCRNVTIRDVQIRESPFWTLHFADCDGVVLSGARISGNLLVPNNDGVDFT